MIDFDFPLILLLVTAIAGAISLTDIVLRKKYSPPSKSILIEYSRSFFPVLFAVLIIRSFVCQMYRVPTGSLEPTVMPGDLVLVTEYSYGLRLPVWGTKILDIAEPMVGQIAPFHSPVNYGLILIKRVVGTPGDHISYINKVLYINGVKQPQKLLGTAMDSDGPGTPTWKVSVYLENINGLKHKIYRRPDVLPVNFYNMIVPKNEYLMMGDNRDNSDDGRYWGFTPEKDFIGRARMILINLKKDHFKRVGIDL